MRSRSTFRWQPLIACTALAVAVAGCEKQGADVASEMTASAGATSPAAEGACRLLTSSEVDAVFAGAKKGEVDNSRQQYGISACIWSTERGTFVAQFWTSTGGTTAKDEARGLMLGALDPLKGQAARNNVRYEAVQGVGEQAVAVLETQDDQRGVLNDFAMLVAQRGDHILVLIAPELARSERGKALTQLQALGQSAANRLQPAR